MLLRLAHRGAIYGHVCIGPHQSLSALFRLTYRLDYQQEGKPHLATVSGPRQPEENQIIQIIPGGKAILDVYFGAGVVCVEPYRPVSFKAITHRSGSCYIINCRLYISALLTV